MAYWYTYAIPSWETELEEIELEMNEEYAEEELYQRELAKYEMWLFDQKMDFYEDFGACGGPFTKFYYKTPHPYTEDNWCTPSFRTADPMGLFYRYINQRTFDILMKDIFKMRTSHYRAWGNQSYSYDQLKTLILFAERWCHIHILYDDADDDYNYKLTLWVASRIVLFLNR